MPLSLIIGAGYEARPRRHCPHLRRKRDPQAEREAEPLKTSLASRCGRRPCTDCSHHATNHWQHDEGQPKSGRGYEVYES